MKKIMILTAALLVLLPVTFLFSGCQNILVTKNGKAETGETKTTQYDLSGFTRVDIGSAFEYEIKRSDNFSVSITANSNLLDDIKVTQEGQTLIIGMEFPGAPWTLFNVRPGPKAIITMPQLQGLDISGATRGSIIDFSSSEDLNLTVSGASSVELKNVSTGNANLEVSGASKITGDIKARDLTLEVSGASSVKMDGSADSLDIEGSGASSLKLADFKVESASVTLSGASSGTVSLDGKLDVRLSGASTLEYTGDPNIGKTEITGASNLRKK